LRLGNNRAVGGPVSKRKILTFALIALVALGGWFYSFYFKSTTAAIRHAEAFLFRRSATSAISANVRIFLLLTGPPTARLFPRRKTNR
jgi:hypothetical protein